MKLLRHSLVAALLVTAAIPPANAAGVFATYPQVGAPATCAGNIVAGVPGTSSVCSSTIPAGPSALTGNENAPADTELPNGVQPQTVLIPSGMFITNPQVNALVGADFGLNLWQRANQSAGNITPSTAAMGPDGWYLYSSGNTVNWSKQTGTTDTFPGTLASFRIQRPSGTNTTQICTGQVLPVKESQRFLGNNGIFSAYLLAGSGMSSSGDAVTLTIGYYTAADNTVAQTNTNNFASSVGSTANITGYTELVNSTQNISTTWTRYSTSAAIPTANASGTAVSGVGVKICYTPTGTGSSTDYFEVALPQFEPRLGTSLAPSVFNRRLPTEEWQFEYSRFFETNENNETQIHGVAQDITTTTAEAYVQFPVELRLQAPTMTYASGFAVPNAGGTPQTCTALTTATSANSSQKFLSPLGVSVLCTIGAGNLVAGNSAIFIDNNNTGSIQVSAEP